MQQALIHKNIVGGKILNADLSNVGITKLIRRI